MQNTKRHELEKESYSTNRFNSAEYERWSGGTTSAQSLKAQWGIENFLGTSENLRAGRKEISVSLIEIDEKQK
jgi:hypothetical protein